MMILMIDYRKKDKFPCQICGGLSQLNVIFKYGLLSLKKAIPMPYSHHQVLNAINIFAYYTIKYIPFKKKTF